MSGWRCRSPRTPRRPRWSGCWTNRQPLKLKLQAQPIEGKANEALVKFLAKALGVPRSAVTITHGLSNKNKLIEIAAPALTLAQVEQRLLPPSANQ